MTSTFLTLLYCSLDLAYYTGLLFCGALFYIQETVPRLEPHLWLHMSVKWVTIVSLLNALVRFSFIVSCINHQVEAF